MNRPPNPTRLSRSKTPSRRIVTSVEDVEESGWNARAPLLKADPSPTAPRRQMTSAGGNAKIQRARVELDRAEQAAQILRENGVDLRTTTMPPTRGTTQLTSSAPSNATQTAEQAFTKFKIKFAIFKTAEAALVALIFFFASVVLATGMAYPSIATNSDNPLLCCVNEAAANTSHCNFTHTHPRFAPNSTTIESRAMSQVSKAFLNKDITGILVAAWAVIGCTLAVFVLWGVNIILVLILLSKPAMNAEAEKGKDIALTVTQSMGLGAAFVATMMSFLLLKAMDPTLVFAWNTAGCGSIPTTVPPNLKQPTDMILPHLGSWAKNFKLTTMLVGLILCCVFNWAIIQMDGILDKMFPLPSLEQRQEIRTKKDSERKTSQRSKTVLNPQSRVSARAIGQMHDAMNEAESRQRAAMATGKRFLSGY